MSIWMIPLGIAIILTRLFPQWLGWAFLVNAVTTRRTQGRVGVRLAPFDFR